MTYIIMVDRLESVISIRHIAEVVTMEDRSVSRLLVTVVYKVSTGML